MEEMSTDSQMFLDENEEYKQRILEILENSDKFMQARDIADEIGRSTYVTVQLLKELVFEKKVEKEVKDDNEPTYYLYY